MNYSPLITNKTMKFSKNIYKTTEDDEYDMYQDKVQLKNSAKLALKGENYKACDVTDELSDLFFSEKNTTRIQKLIKREVLTKTNGQFKLDEDQADLDLLIAMRAVYMQEARHLPYNIKQQVKDLNRKLLLHIVPDMITAIKQNYSYIKEINEPIKPIMRPLNVNNAGRRMLPSITSVWNF